MRRFFLAAPALLTALVSSPAMADHMGPTGAGTGGGMAVFGPHTLDAGHGALDFRLVYSRPEQRSDETLEALAGQHVHAHNTDYNLVASLGAAYGVTHHLTVSAELPYLRRDRLREGEHSHVGGATVNEVVQLGNVSGIGDVSLLAKYRLTEGEDVGFALVVGIKLPTGSTRRRSREGERLETEHQPGTGSWDPIVGASAGVKMGAMRLTGSALFQRSGKGAQRTRLGDRLQGGIALSHRFGAEEHHHDDDAGAHHHNQHHGDELDERRHDEAAGPSWDAFVELGGEWEGRQKVAGETEQASGGAWAYVAPGVRFSSGTGWSAGAAIALPFWQDIRASHPDNRYRAMLSVGRSF